MSRLDYYLGIGLVCLALFGGLFVHAKIVSDRNDAQSLAQLQKIYSDAHLKDTQAITKASAAEAQNQKDTAKQLQTIVVERQAPVVPIDYGKIDAMIAQHVGTTAHTETDSAGVAQTTLPTEPLRNFTLDSDSCKLKLSSCATTVANLTQERDALQSDNAALETKADKEEVLLKGGTFWHRVGAGVKHAACGAAGTGIGLAASKSPGVGAGVGLGVFGVCELVASHK